MLKLSKAKATLTKSRKLFFTTIIGVAAILLAGCFATDQATKSGNDPGNDAAKDDLGAKKIYAPVAIPYVTDNPLEIIYVDESEDTNHQRSYIQISGLRDKTVENKINEAIQALYKQMIPYATGEKLVPYRGIMSVVSPEREVDHSYLSVEVHFNCNNILSVGAHLSGSYLNSEHYNQYFSMIDSLNMDMNTGETFLLNDVFTDDIDGIKVANDTILAEVNRRMLSASVEFGGYHSPLTMVAPFKGVSQRQKFFLSDNGIQIVIDHNNPEFDFGFSSTTIIIPYYSTEGQIAIMERFFDENQTGSSIYINQEPKLVASKRFLNDYQIHSMRESDVYTKNGTEWFVTFGHTDSLSERFVSIMSNLRTEQEDMINELAKESPVSFAEQNIYAYQMGTFVNINAHLYYTQDNRAQWQEQKLVYSDDGKLVALADLFVDGYNYEDVIKDKIIETIKEYGISVEQDAEKLVQGIAFTINDTNLSFSTQPITEEGMEENSHPLHFSISYGEIGQDNLNIFK